MELTPWLKPPVTYVKKIQYRFITIPLNAASNTTTISSVDTSLAWVELLGFTTDSTANQQLIVSPRVALTNSTTVTVNRNTSTASCTVSVVVKVTEATSSLVESVQQGTINAVSSSGTATITAVDRTRSAVYYLGNTGSTSGTIAPRMFALTLSADTTVQANSNSTPTTAVIGYVVVQYKAAAIQSLQQFSNAFTTANTTDTQAMSAVVLANTIIAYGGVNNGGTGFYNIQPSSTTNINLTRVATGIASRTPRYTVIEFVPGVIKANTLTRLYQDMTNINGLIGFITPVLNFSRTAFNFCGWRNTSTDTPDKLFMNFQPGLQIGDPGEGTGTQMSLSYGIGAGSASTKGVGLEYMEYN